MAMAEPNAPSFDREQADAIHRAAVTGDLDALRAMVARGWNLNGYDQYGDTLLEGIVAELPHHPQVPRYDVVREMIRLGVDPKRRGKDGSSALTSAVLAMDTEMLRILLDAGANPNAEETSEPGESLLDFAIRWYCFDVWEDREAEKATPDQCASVDNYLAYLHGLAMKYHARVPDHILLLRERGAASRQLPG